MSGIFISYRREDSSADAGRLLENLQRRCPQSEVFMDLNIVGGDQFRDVIAAKLDACVALLVLIGPKWLDMLNPETGRPRLHEEDDFVRFEVARAIERGKVVIPVLLPGAALPGEAHLPDDVKGLVRRQAVELRHRHWTSDVNELVSQLPETLRCGREVELPANRWLYLLLLPVLLLATVVVIAAPYVAIRPEFVASGVAAGIGAVHASIFKPSVSWNVLLAGCISLASVALMSIVAPLLAGQSIMPTNVAVELQLAGRFVVAIVAGYLVGGVCADLLYRRRRAT
jgi:hypothetical protein